MRTLGSPAPPVSTRTPSGVTPPEVMILPLIQEASGPPLRSTTPFTSTSGAGSIRSAVDCSMATGPP
jgi:hypothetical protein